MCKDWDLGFANTPGTVLKIPILRTLAFRGLYWGPLRNLPYVIPQTGPYTEYNFFGGIYISFTYLAVSSGQPYVRVP